MPRILLALTAALAALSGLARADSYPDRPVHIVVGFGAGGPDTTARLIAAQLSAQTGKRFLVDNKPGASGVIAAEFVAEARPDGYTLLAAPASLASLPSLRKRLPFRVPGSFAPITEIAASEASFLVTPVSLPVNTLQDFMAFARNPANRVSYASTGIGTGSHLRMALFSSANHLSMVHVPFKSPGEAVVSVMGGQTQALFLTTSQALPLIKAHKIKALAYDFPTRDPYLPSVPTMTQAGAAPTRLDSGWNGLLAPAGAPAPVLHWLEAETRKAVATPEIQERLKNLGLIPRGTSAEEFGAILAASVKDQAAAARAAGIQPQ